MARPSLRRALRRSGVTPAPRPTRAERGPRSQSLPPPPRIFLPGEEAVVPPPPLDPARLFGRGAPLELEIGVGKGRFLLAEAAAHPEHDFLGLEIEPGYAALAAEKASRLGLGNLRVYAVDAKPFVSLRLPEASLTRLHVYFPDPWPKKRHHKRRLFDAGFARAAARALVAGGELRVASDHAEYFTVIVEVLNAEPLLERLPDSDWSPGTSYAVKFAEEGRAIGKGIWRRRPN